MANLSKLSLYIHIPFCVKRCRYCDFYSETGAGADIIEKTLDALILSLDKSLEHLIPESFPTIFIGGGTPSLIPVKQLDDFLSRLIRRTGKVEEFTIEVNPESLSREFLEVLNAHSVNRISMGVQSYNDVLLSWLGRPAGRNAIERADSLLSEYWKGRLSRDLLAGLPLSLPGLDGRRRLLDDIDSALKNNPGHLSLYELTVEKGTPLSESRKDLLKLPGESAQLEEWMEALDFLSERGYFRYEISNFALKGEESLHNLNYWRMQPYLGIGPGAASTIPSFSGKALRREERADLKAWLSNPASSFKEELISTRDFALEHFMMGLRTSEGVDISRFTSIFSVNPADLLGDALKRWTVSGMLESDSDSIRPTPEGMELLDTVLADIALELDKWNWPESYHWPQP